MTDIVFIVANETSYDLTLLDKGIDGLATTDSVRWAQSPPEHVASGKDANFKAHLVFLAQMQMFVKYRFALEGHGNRAVTLRSTFSRSLTDPHELKSGAHFSDDISKQFYCEVSPGKGGDYSQLFRIKEYIGP